MRRSFINQPARLRLGLAYHEAGHAVVAHHLGLDVHEVWIDEAMQDGKTTLWGSPDPRQSGLIALAGGVAQGRFDPATIHPGDGTRAPALLGDMAKLHEVLMAAAPDSEPDRDRLRREWRHEAAAILNRPEIWHAVAAVAAVLEAKRRLSAAEFKAALGG